MSSDKTPIRIRGKRTGTPLEKWYARKCVRPIRRRAAEHEPSMSVSPSNKGNNRSVRRRRLHESALEQLPTEMIQAIFVQSHNIGLPLTCSNLIARLSGKQLQWELTCDAMMPIILQSDNAVATTVQLANASRLLNSRFMTWDFFRRWLDHQSDVRRLDIQESNPSEDQPLHSRYADIWIALQPSRRFALPSKVVRGPWAPDRIAFLKVFSLHSDGCSRPLEGIVAEVAHEGLQQAVAQSSLEVIRLLRNLHVKPDQDLLRRAVIDHGCDKDIVLYLLQWCVVELMRWDVTPVQPENTLPPEFDFLDPMLWAWTDKAKAVGEPKGEWLTGVLRLLSNTVISENTREQLERLERDDSIYVSQWQ